MIRRAEEDVKWTTVSRSHKKKTFAQVVKEPPNLGLLSIDCAFQRTVILEELLPWSVRLLTPPLQR